MLPDQADLDICKKASKLELQELKERNFHYAFTLELEALLLDVYASLLPSASQYEQRKQLIYAFNIIAKNIFGNTGGFPVVEAFGSFIMNIFTAESDLDLSINFNNSIATCFTRDQVVSVLRRISKVLFKEQRNGHLSGVLPILHARVPVLKAVDCKTGIECDISVENRNGISRSLFFSFIASIDERFRIMSYLMKAWAKGNDINSSKDGTINSLSIISLVAFHFQTRDPPILPPFSILLRDGTDVTNLRNAILAFRNSGVRNEESVAELFVSLLVKLFSVEKLWELGLCASNFEGSWISKTWDSKVGNMSVEDFLDRSQNFARSVGKFEMPKIYDCLRQSLEHLSCSMEGKIELSALRSFLFGSFSLDSQTNRIKSKASMTIKQKQSVRQKQTYSESAQVHVGDTRTTDRADGNATTTPKRKLPSSEAVDSPVSTTSPSDHPSSNLTKNLELKPPNPESSQHHINKITGKRARHSKAGEASRSTYLPRPTTYPVLLNPPPQPVNIFGQPHSPFDISLGGPPRPIYANMVYGPHHNQLIYASQYHPTVPAHFAYGSQGPLYFPNPVIPLFPWYPVHNNTGHPQHHVPPRWLGPNHF